MNPLPPLPGYHLIEGDKGNQWCYAAGHRAALTVYRRIEPRTPHETTLRVLATLHELAEGNQFWVRDPRKPSQTQQFTSWYMEQQGCA